MFKWLPNPAKADKNNSVSKSELILNRSPKPSQTNKISRCDRKFRTQSAEQCKVGFLRDERKGSIAIALIETAPFALAQARVNSFNSHKAGRGGKSGLQRPTARYHLEFLNRPEFVFFEILDPSETTPA
jgi:hypothetical protein